MELIVGDHNGRADHTCDGLDYRGVFELQGHLSVEAPKRDKPIGAALEYQGPDAGAEVDTLEVTGFIDHADDGFDGEIRDCSDETGIF